MYHPHLGDTSYHFQAELGQSTEQDQERVGQRKEVRLG